MEWLKVQGLSSKPSTTKKKKRKRLKGKKSSVREVLEIFQDQTENLGLSLVGYEYNWQAMLSSTSFNMRFNVMCDNLSHPVGNTQSLQCHQAE
jgi:hypothetical protein